MADTATSTPPLNDLVVKWRAKFPQAYDNIDDATLTKKILAKYPVYSSLAVPSPSSAPRPAPPKDLAPSTASERIGERIESNLEAIPNALEGRTASYQAGLKSPKAIAEAEAEKKQARQGLRHVTGLDSPTTAGKVADALTIAPRMIYEQGKQYVHDPSSFFGDLVLMLPELSEMHFAKPNKVWNQNG